MRHDKRERRGQLHAEVAVGDGVEAVEADAVEAELRSGGLAVYWVGRPGKGAGTERGEIHALCRVG